MFKLAFLFLSLFSTFLFGNELSPLYKMGEDESPYELKAPSYEGTFIKMLLVIVILLALAALVLYLMKTFTSTRLKQENHFKNIKILEKRAISPKSILYLIEIGGKKILIGESQLELRELSHLPWIEIEKKNL